MAPHQKEVLPPRGYLIADLGLSAVYHQALSQEAQGRDYTCVFKRVGCKQDDQFREQSRVVHLSAALTELKRRLSAVTTCLDPGWIPNVFSFMRSIPLGEEQEAHQDYPERVIARSKTTNATRVPASMIYALQPGTKLRVYDGCFITKDDACVRIIEIPVGFCVVFRGDLIHNGAAYKSQNYRIHCYLSYRGLKWKPDVVNSVLPPHLKCKYCGVKLPESNLMRQHRRYCSKNPDNDRNKIIRRRTDNKMGSSHALFVAWLTRKVVRSDLTCLVETTRSPCFLAFN
jgi:hypothetical protein